MFKILLPLFLLVSQAAYSNELKIEEIVTVGGLSYFGNTSMSIRFETLDGKFAPATIAISPLGGDFTLNIRTKLFGMQSIKIEMDHQQFIDTLELAKKNKMPIYLHISKIGNVVGLDSIVVGDSVLSK